MKPKTLMMLAVITLVVILGAAFLGQERQNTPTQSGQLVFPDLMNHINNVSQLTIETKGKTITLVQQDNQWTVKEKGGYAAAFEKIKPVLIGMAELKIREPKTKNPDLYEKLGLQDKDAEGSSSTLISLKTKDANAIAALLLGNQKPAKGVPSLSEMYVRKPDDPQTWLVTGKLPVEKTLDEWLEKDLLDIINKRIQRVSVIHPDGERLTIYKDTPDALDFKVSDLPRGTKVNSQFNVNNVATTLAKLTMEDVKHANEIEMNSQSGVQAVLETFDGLRLTIETKDKDGATFGKISAAFDPALAYKGKNGQDDVNNLDQGKETAETKKDGKSKEGPGAESDVQGEVGKSKTPTAEAVLKSKDEVEKDVIDLNKKLSNWVFELPKFRVDNFSKKKEDLIAKK